MKIISIIALLIISCSGQRSPYAGRGHGFPALDTTTTITTAGGLGDRFGSDDTTTTQRLPIEALGDRELVNALSKLPIDKQPFWYINWKAIESHRQKPKTYEPKPNTFIDMFWR